MALRNAARKNLILSSFLGTLILPLFPMRQAEERNSTSITFSLCRSSVFPVEAGKTQKVRLTYEHLLPADGDRVDYLLPRTESLAYSVPWKVSVRIKSKRPISTVYSPSHKLETRRIANGIVSARIASDSGEAAANCSAWPTVSGTIKAWRLVSVPLASSAR